MWDLPTGRALRQIPFIANADPNDSRPRAPAGPGAGWAIYTATVSPGGRLLAFGSANSIEIRDVATGNVVQQLEKLSDSVGAMQFSPDSRMLAISGQRGATVRLIEVASGQERHCFRGHRGRIWSIAFSADGQRLLTGSDDTMALLWALPGKLYTTEPLTARDLDLHWSILARPDALHAFQSMRRLAASPSQTIPYLKAHLPPAKRIGEQAVRSPSPEHMRASRVVEILEWIGTPEARQVLDALAQGIPDAPLTQEAKTSLQRLARRQTE